MSSSSSTAAAPSSSPTPSLDDMLNLGILVESIAGYPDLPMTSAIDTLLRNNNNSLPAKISQIIASTLNSNTNNGNIDPNATVHDLLAYLQGLPEGESLAYKNRSAFIAMTVLCFLAVALRFYVRRRITQMIRREEWWCIAGFIGTICACILFVWIHTKHYGAGQHVWNISYHTLQRFAMMLYPLETLFVTAFWPIKISFLIFYHSLSPQPIYRRAVWTVGIFVTILTLTGDLLVFFQCKPISYWNHLTTAKCYNRDTVFTAWGTLNILTDFGILLLPVPIVLRLQLKKREKAAVLSIFATGAFICIVGINRLVTMRVWLRHADSSFLFGKTAVWTLLEIDSALIISCVPALKLLLVKPKLTPMSVESRRRSIPIFSGSKVGKSAVNTGTGTSQVDCSRAGNDEEETMSVPPPRTGGTGGTGESGAVLLEDMERGLKSGGTTATTISATEEDIADEDRAPDSRGGGAGRHNVAFRMV